MFMKRIQYKYWLYVLLIFFSVNLFAESNAQNSPVLKGENIHYNLYYQWGLIWKKAAQATLSTQETIYQSNKALRMRMAAQTTSFFDNFMRVRDTLISLTTPEFKPLFYTKISHEGDYYAKDELYYYYNSGKTKTRAKTFRKGVQRDDTTLTHNGNPVYDMMSIFAYIRTLDIVSMKKNQTIPMVIVSGNKSYNIKVTYNGEDNMKSPQDEVFPTYKLSIIFEHVKKNKIEKEVMEIWISKDARRIPMQLTAKLPIGSLKAFYQGID
jgi:Protein of unknown function (DUF3108).